MSLIDGSRALERTIERIGPADPRVARDAARLLDAKTKPIGSLGRLEGLAVQLSAIRRAVPTRALRPAVVVALADHGVADESVSAYPSAVTRQMLANVAAGGAAVCVLARQAGARLVVVDAGVDAPPAVHGVRSVAIEGWRGTANFAEGPAMSRRVALGLIEEGIALAAELEDDGIEVIAVGELGIANTTAAAAISAALVGATPERVCGRGTGIDDAGLARKIDTVRRSLSCNGLEGPTLRTDPVGVLAAVGGLEIAFLVGLILGAAERRVPVLLDGFVTAAAALVASGLAPDCVASMIAATRSPEPGHDVVLDALDLEPLLDLGLRLGEGSGAALALPLVRAAVAILTEMATFESAGVSGSRR